MLLERLGKELLYFDGGMGTLLQSKGLKPGELPEVWNIEHADEVVDIHRQYFEAGSDIVLANTFGANALKFHDASYDLREIVNAAIANVKKGASLGAGAGRRTYTALDVGPTGKLLKPMGDLGFEDAYEAFREVMKYGEEAGADLIHIETMSDTFEVKAAVLAAKETTDLPVFATMIFDEKGKLLTGGDVPSVVALLEGLRVDALGINCGMGPEQMLPILEEILAYTSLPVIVKPNAGLPKQKDGQVYYDVDSDQFARTMEKIVHMGACVIGGCCGTTPGHIRAMVDRTKGLSVVFPSHKDLTIVSSYGKAVVLGEKPVIIGERINPTGKKKFKQALKDHDLDYILKEGITQQDKGAHILDVNVGLPDIDGQKVLSTVRSWTQTPVIVVSARSHERDKVESLDLGADDYITKPFGTSELLARVRTALRHSQNRADINASGGVFRAGKMRIDYDKRRVTVDGADVHLTQTEYNIVALLSRHAGRVLTYDFVMRETWGPGVTGGSNQILRVNMAAVA